MKKTILSILAFSLIAASITACQQAAAGSIVNDQTEAESSQTEAATQAETATDTENTESSEFNEDVEFTKSEFIEEPNARIDLFSSKIRFEDKEYEAKAFIYYLREETDTYVKGELALELCNSAGEKINAMSPIIGYIGQYGKRFIKGQYEDYFNVIKLDGGEVLAVTYPEDNGLMTTIFCTVSNGELVLMERYYTEEEKKRLEMDDPHGHPITEKTCFNTTDKFTADGNSLVFELSSEISDNDNTFPAGEIPLVFDFENNTVKCEKDEYKGMVYYS